PPATSTVPATGEPATQQPRTEEARTETATPSSTVSESPGTGAPATSAPEKSATEKPAEATETTPAETTPAETTAETEQVEPMARVIETVKPAVLEAPADDLVLASKAAPVEVKPEPAKVEDLAALSSLVGLADERDRLAQERRELREDQRELREDQRQLRADQRELRADQRDWDNRVRQWSPDWVQYDEFYRPMIVNPYRDPVRIVYEYQNQPRVVTIPPLQRMVMYVADLAAYSFTAVVLNTVNTVVSTAVGVAVGSFFGGGFIPTIANIGAIAPPPPPPLFRYDNVPVQVRYSDAVYEPFRVQRIVDIGDDTRYGERRVLLDGATPAWGVWKQSAGGERMFEVHRTQQYPGLDEPREGPLPGDYRLRLAAEEAPATGSNQTLLITAAVACAVLSLGAVGGAALLGRRRRV
ncbi:cell division protein ZapB, partial [Mycolicibacterium neoaurum]|uniref:cell division protein ZapB n=2 Tax=Mycobacteriaceae TaxID=1762 RepID=UPI00131F2408